MQQVLRPSKSSRIDASTRALVALLISDAKYLHILSQVVVKVHELVHISELATALLAITQCINDNLLHKLNNTTKSAIGSGNYVLARLVAKLLTLELKLQLSQYGQEQQHIIFRPMSVVMKLVTLLLQGTRLTN